uniref:Minor tail protein n=5 Tax=unclassified Caudoviricetes TaxID=2788787 RepID=A0AB39U2H6_9CAUD
MCENRQPLTAGGWPTPKENRTVTAALIDLVDGQLSELEISKPGFIYAGRLTNMETGASWRFVYRSTIVKTTSRIGKRMLAWLDGAAPIGQAQIAADPDMMYGTAELTLWEP